MSSYCNVVLPTTKSALHSTTSSDSPYTPPLEGNFAPYHADFDTVEAWPTSKAINNLSFHVDDTPKLSHFAKHQRIKRP